MDNIKSYGVVRKIDRLGRIVVPKDMREFYGIKSDTPLEIAAVEEGILLRVKNKEKRR